MLPAESVTGRTYRVAHTYIDKGNPHLDGDEFSGWLAIGRLHLKPAQVQGAPPTRTIPRRLALAVSCVTATTSRGLSAPTQPCRLTGQWFRRLSPNSLSCGAQSTRPRFPS